jgi:hypothetical protein
MRLTLEIGEKQWSLDTYATSLRVSRAWRWLRLFLSPRLRRERDAFLTREGERRAKAARGKAVFDSLFDG